MASHSHEYDYKGHDLEQELLDSSIVSRILGSDIRPDPDTLTSSADKPSLASPGSPPRVDRERMSARKGEGRKGLRAKLAWNKLSHVEISV